MAVTQSTPKSSSKSNSKAPAAARRSGPTAQERLVQGLIELMQQGVAPWRNPTLLPVRQSPERHCPIRIISVQQLRPL
jgi:hypothetical protein